MTTAVLALGLALVAAPGQAQDFNTLLQGLGRALNPDEERERTERRSRYEELRRRDEGYDDQDRAATRRRPTASATTRRRTASGARRRGGSITSG